MDFELPEFAQQLSNRPDQGSAQEPGTLKFADDIEVVVLVHGAKPAVTAETLGSLGIPYRLYENEDWEWPEDHPELREDRTQRPIIRGYALRQYRAYRGHQEILRSAKTDFTLVFEDDMSIMPTSSPEEVVKQVNAARKFITETGFDAVSFHGREIKPQRSITLYGREYIEMRREIQDSWGQQYFLRPVARGFNGKYEDYQFKWHEGCLAYLVGAKGRQKWIDAGHGAGMPCDLFLANELNTIVMRNTMFKHDFRHGSLIANTGRIKRKLKDDGTPEAK